MEFVIELLRDYTLRNVALGSAILGIVSGVLGSFAVLRRQGLMGDALSHAALPGVCLAYILTGSKAPGVLMTGAAIAGLIGMAAILQITRRTRIDSGSALGIILTVFFGFGVVLLTLIQQRNDANQAGLDKFLLGQAAALVQEQVQAMAILGGLALLLVSLLFKEFKLLTFDPEFAGTIGFAPQRVGAVLTGLLVVAIVIGLNTVGVILMSAMLVTPGAAARQWTQSLAKMIFIAAGIGAASGLVGAILSVLDSKVPTGPSIVLCLAVAFIFSLFFGSARGIFWQSLQQRQNRQSLTAPEFTGDQDA
jgi:manganese/zinc/iron transport system permease protein